MFKIMVCKRYCIICIWQCDMFVCSVCVCVHLHGFSCICIEVFHLEDSSDNPGWCIELDLAVYCQGKHRGAGKMIGKDDITPAPPSLLGQVHKWCRPKDKQNKE